MINTLLKEKSVWEKLMVTRKPIILYGMGDGADRVLQEFELLNIHASGVMASDDFVRGQSFHKFTVKTLAQIKEEFKDFIILITFGTHIPEVMANIKALEKEYEVMIPSIPVAGECIFNRSYIVRNGEEIINAYNLMADEESKEVFKNMCYFEYTGELKYLYAMESSKDEAFKILNLNSEEDYLDLGAYRGDTIDEFLKYTCNHYHSITALEPEPKTFKKLVEAKGDLENTTLLNKAVWSFVTELEFRADMGRGSLIKNNGGLLAETVSIDSLAEDTKFTYIKMDVEGVEFVALSGGMTLMAEHKPKLNIACYHRCCDIYRLPAVIIEPTLTTKYICDTIHISHVGTQTYIVYKIFIQKNKHSILLILCFVVIFIP